MQKSVLSIFGGMSCIPDSSTCVGDGNHMWERAIKGVAQKVAQTQDGQEGNEINSTGSEDGKE